MIFGDDFEGGQGEWGVGSDGQAGTVWELGTPSVVGPASAASPVNCFGTNLAANYGLDADVWLRSPAIDLTAAGAATLSYAQFRDIEQGFDFGMVRVLDAADDSELAVIEAIIDDVSAGWEKVSKALPAEA
ncbi:MAG: hypothetical protein GWO24_02225, partial [Akkermansiaceae bacterium]|nr:hypothetical protein [Akkermansiaceae bacterium]